MSKKAGATLKIALVGAAGRMGQEIQKLATECNVEVSTTIGAKKAWTKVKPAGLSVVVDFSSPTGLSAALAWCVANKKPLVSGTTGLSDKDLKQLKGAAQHIPILYSGNMSLGIAVVSAMLENFRATSEWDFQIEEAHHSLKKDRPSGTALLLQRKLQTVVERELPAPLSLRGGSVPGIHTVFAFGPGESITLQHTAFNRQVFARGALGAARWLFDKKQPGLYDLSDLYKI